MDDYRRAKLDLGPYCPSSLWLDSFFIVTESSLFLFSRFCTVLNVFRKGAEKESDFDKFSRTYQGTKDGQYVCGRYRDLRIKMWTAWWTSHGGIYREHLFAFEQNRLEINLERLASIGRLIKCWPRGIEDQRV